MKRYAPPPAQAAFTVISFCVSVPVLSEQITVVEPSVSTAGSFRMMAWRCAMRATPIASVIVSAAGSPSGIAPTASATAARNMSSHAWPCNTPTTNVTPASARITHNRTWENCAIFRVSGVASASVVWISSEMRPISVRSPVATTTPRAAPYVASVDE